MNDRVIVITAALAALPVEGPFAEYPFEITRSRRPPDAEADAMADPEAEGQQEPALHTGFFGHAWSVEQCRQAYKTDHGDGLVTWQFTARWRGALPEELTPGFEFSES